MKTSRDGIEQRLRKVIAAECDVPAENVRPESRFAEDLRADSLGRVEMMLAAEHEFGIDIPDNDINSVRTVKEAADLIERLLEAKEMVVGAS